MCKLPCVVADLAGVPLTAAPQHCRQFLVKEALYPYTSGSTNSSGTCNQARIASATADDRVQLTGSGYRQVQQWSATALREVRGLLQFLLAERWEGVPSSTLKVSMSPTVPIEL